MKTTLLLLVCLSGCGGATALPSDLGSDLQVTCEFEPFVDCGCGCCGGTEPIDVCVRASAGETLSSVRGDPVQPTPAQCATVGCSLGLRYLCCD